MLRFRLAGSGNVSATHLSNCLLCMPGTYSLDVGRTTNCPTCEANYYCRTSTLKESCPMHTTSAAGSYSRLNCRCTPGYSCFPVTIVFSDIFVIFVWISVFWGCQS